MRHAAIGFLVGLLASLPVWAWGKMLTLILQEEGTGNILRDLVVTAPLNVFIVAVAFVCALIMPGLAVRDRGSVVVGFLTGAILGAGSAIALVLIGWVAGLLDLTELIAGMALVGLLVGIVKGLIRKR